jgi:hypothetical protein
MTKKFDPTKPHNHQCPHCWKQIHCRGVNCEIPERAECLECKRGETVEKFTQLTHFFRNSTGYRHTWPGRDR